MAVGPSVRPSVQYMSGILLKQLKLASSKQQIVIGSDVACQIVAFPMTLSYFLALHLLQICSSCNFFCKVVQQLTRFQLTARRAVPLKQHLTLLCYDLLL